MFLELSFAQSAFSLPLWKRWEKCDFFSEIRNFDKVNVESVNETAPLTVYIQGTYRLPSCCQARAWDLFCVSRTVICSVGIFYFLEKGDFFRMTKLWQSQCRKCECNGTSNGIFMKYLLSTFLLPSKSVRSLLSFSDDFDKKNSVKFRFEINFKKNEIDFFLLSHTRKWKNI